MRKRFITHKKEENPTATTKEEKQINQKEKVGPFQFTQLTG